MVQYLKAFAVISTVVGFGALMAPSANAADISYGYDDGHIILSGSIERGDAGKFANLFHEDVYLVELESPGGLSNEGQAIAKLIYDHGAITTGVLGTCTSACATIWLSGNYHLEYPEGLIGFHLSYIPEVPFLENHQKEYGIRGVEELHKKQVLDDVYVHYLLLNNPETITIWMEGIFNHGTLGHEMWFPTVEQLKQFEE